MTHRNPREACLSLRPQLVAHIEIFLAPRETLLPVLGEIWVYSSCTSMGEERVSDWLEKHRLWGVLCGHSLDY